MQTSEVLFACVGKFKEIIRNKQKFYLTRENSDVEVSLGGLWLRRDVQVFNLCHNRKGDTKGKFKFIYNGCNECNSSPAESF